MADHTTEAKAIFFDDAATRLLELAEKNDMLPHINIERVTTNIFQLRSDGFNRIVNRSNGYSCICARMRLAVAADKQHMKLEKKLPKRPTSSYPYADMSRVLSQAASNVDEIALDENHRGYRYDVRTGRRDGVVSLTCETTRLPLSTFNLNQLTQMEDLALPDCATCVARVVTLLRRLVRRPFIAELQDLTI
ncbi:hypothetical protein Tco_1100448, partial [Tanacetum coccineum]